MLDLVINSLSVDEIQSGLHHILEALLFLHTKAFLSHNNLNPASIFVASSGEWKLGGFEFSSPLHVSQQFLHSKFSASIRPKEYLPPKQTDSGLPNDSPFSNDAFSFGKLIDYALDSCEGKGKEESVQCLRGIAAQLTCGDPAQRIQLSALLGHPAISNSLIEIIEFCSTIHLKTDEEKTAFFSPSNTSIEGALRDVVPHLRSIPADVVARRLSRLLLSRYVLLEARSQTELYPALLVTAEDENGILPRDLFQRHMIPEILRLFKVRESAVRTVLLSHFHGYARHIGRERLVGFVTDEVIQGCHDSDNQLVAASLRALAVLVEIAGADAVCPWPISKIFANGSPLRSRAAVNVMSADLLYQNSLETDDAERIQKRGPATASGDTNRTWSDEVSNSQEVEKRTTSSVKSHASVLRTGSTTGFKKNIGSEFEISVSTQRSLEDDLLADLAPKITTTSLIEQLSSLRSTVDALSAVKKVPPKFVMLDTAEEAEGWEESVDESITNIEEVGMVCARANA
ncbi:hypothetical protein TELCIR_01486 [Teladorsagia circumcincta]|uniref:Protein kinase domain-containing protein n=1 Tax=Teladorsagia circumcincta TaxID=45464 RepID=A0A2G9V239_TELCI|nr:hypothetical protein TELCIR_01486 [Teladorsagia circumcincta]